MSSSGPCVSFIAFSLYLTIARPISPHLLPDCCQVSIFCSHWHCADFEVFITSLCVSCSLLIPYTTLVRFILFALVKLFSTLKHASLPQLPQICVCLTMAGEGSMSTRPACHPHPWVEVCVLVYRAQVWTHPSVVDMNHVDADQKRISDGKQPNNHRSTWSFFFC